MHSLLVGLLSSFALIVAIGAQNAFVLRQGLRREHVGTVVAICAVADAALITAGIVGLGVAITQAPVLLTVIRWLGFTFLLGYAGLAARRALRPAVLEAAPDRQSTRRRAALTCLALTFLNPHVYLDTVVLLGSLGNQQGSSGRWWFAAGAVTASISWFSALGYGSRHLGRLLARPRAWQVLDAGIAVVMIVLAVLLVV